MANKYDNIDLDKFFTSIPDEIREWGNKKTFEDTERDYENFRTLLEQGVCSLCNQPIEHIDTSNPCMHWFIHPTIKKKLFDKFLCKPLSQTKLESYFRWLANTESIMTNVNDTKYDISSTSKSELTIKYKNFEWSFSLGYTDIDGHNGAKVGDYPHYHIQVVRDGRIFIRFNDYHIPFDDYDLFMMKAIEQGYIKYEPTYGAGIGYLEDNQSSSQEFLKAMTIPENEEDANFRVRSMIKINNGETISTDIINKANEIHTQTREPKQVIIQRLLEQAGVDFSIQTEIIPLEVPAKAKRSGKK